jgi:small nuclear ribonucleoprotein (snRNP)-like protein
MKKTLIFIVFNFLMMQNAVFATIQKLPEKAVPLQETKPHFSFKQKVFTYLIQRKIRRLNAKQPQKSKGLQDCVTITLKNGRTISATIISMDDKNIAYRLCDQVNTAEGNVRVEQVAYVTDAQNRTIFSNQPKMVKTGQPTSGDKNATASITALAIALGAAVLALFTLLSTFNLNGSSGGETTSIALSLIFVIGIVVSFITGLISLGQMATTPPQRDGSKFLAILSTIISGLFVLLMLLAIASN